MVRGVGADRERQAVAIHDRHDFHAFSTLGGSDLGAPALRHHESCVDEAFLFVEHAAFAQFVGDVHESAAQNLTAAPRLKAAMHRFVVRIALREHVPLRAGVEYPKRPFKDLACRDRFAARPPVHNVLFGKVMAESAPTANRSAESFHTYSGSTALGNFEIGSSQFAVGKNRIIHKPTTATFSFETGHTTFKSINWGRADEQLSSGLAYRKDDIIRVAQQLLGKMSR